MAQDGRSRRTPLGIRRKGADFVNVVAQASGAIGLLAIGTVVILRLAGVIGGGDTAHKWLTAASYIGVVGLLLGVAVSEVLIRRGGARNAGFFVVIIGPGRVVSLPVRQCGAADALYDSVNQTVARLANDPRRIVDWAALGRFAFPADLLAMKSFEPRDVRAVMLRERGVDPPAPALKEKLHTLQACP